jgi:hypothetical protein
VGCAILVWRAAETCRFVECLVYSPGAVAWSSKLSMIQWLAREQGPAVPF